MYIYVRNINLTSVSTIVLLDFRTVLTVCYFRFFILSHNTLLTCYSRTIFVILTQSLIWYYFLCAYFYIWAVGVHELAGLTFFQYFHKKMKIWNMKLFSILYFISKLDIKNRSKFNFHLLSLHELVRWFIFNKKQFISGFDISGINLPSNGLSFFPYCTTNNVLVCVYTSYIKISSLNWQQRWVRELINTRWAIFHHSENKSHVWDNDDVCCLLDQYV